MFFSPTHFYCHPHFWILCVSIIMFLWFLLFSAPPTIFMVCVSLPNPHFCYPCSDICLSAPPTSFNSLFLTCVCCVFSPTHLFTVHVSQPHPPFCCLCFSTPPTSSIDNGWNSCVSQPHPPSAVLVSGVPYASFSVFVLLVFLSPTHFFCCLCFWSSCVSQPLTGSWKWVTSSCWVIGMRHWELGS